LKPSGGSLESERFNFASSRKSESTSEALHRINFGNLEPGDFIGARSILDEAWVESYIDSNKEMIYKYAKES